MTDNKAYSGLRDAEEARVWDSVLGAHSRRLQQVKDQIQAENQRLLERAALELRESIEKELGLDRGNFPQSALDHLWRESHRESSAPAPVLKWYLDFAHRMAGGEDD